jgi:hypothetical protein
MGPVHSVFTGRVKLAAFWHVTRSTNCCATHSNAFEGLLLPPLSLFWLPKPLAT